MTDTRELRVEELLARRVYDADGVCIGRIEEIHAERRDDGCFVTEYRIGSYAYMERLSSLRIGRAILRLAGQGSGFRVSWDVMNLSNPRKPCTLVRREELEKLRG